MSATEGQGQRDKDRGQGQGPRDRDKGTGTASQEDRERDTEVGEGQMHKGHRDWNKERGIRTRRDQTEIEGQGLRDTTEGQGEIRQR